MGEARREPSLAGRTYSVDTYGCQMNAHESEKIAGALEGAGLVRAEADAVPDVLVLNTCCIRDSAEQRIVGHIGTLKKKKEVKPGMLVCVTGCLAQQQGSAESLLHTFPFIDVLLGTHATGRIREALEERLTLCKRVCWVPDASGLPEEGAAVRAPGPSAYTNIMYGCNNFCSYCIVPYVRGRERSRPAGQIIQEVAQLTEKGYRQVTLLGQNVNSYRGQQGETFDQLLRAVAAETGVDRIRFMTSHPKDLTEELIRTIADVRAVCRHVHLPVQSGSDAVLASMNRRYTVERYVQLVDRLRDAIPSVEITTDLIVGYPGETDEDFRDTMRLIEEVRFDSAFTFVYSPRKGTKAASLPEQISRAKKKERITELVARQNEITYEKNLAQVGCLERVLVEGPSTRGTGTMCGLTDGSRMVNFEAPAGVQGSIVNVRIIQAKRNSLFGRLEKRENGTTNADDAAVHADQGGKP